MAVVLDWRHGSPWTPWRSEPRTFRNWQAIAYYGSGLVGFALAGVLAVPALWYASIPCVLLLLAATRQHVIVHGTEVELHNVVRQHRIPLSRVDHLSVPFSRGWRFGWRIRVHQGHTDVDTLAFLNLAGFRFVGGCLRRAARRRARARQGDVRPAVGADGYAARPGT